MKFGICGCREYINIALIHRMIQALRDTDEVVCRAATPTDRIIIKECSVRGLVCDIVKADYASTSVNNRYCRNTRGARQERDEKILSRVGSVLYFSDGTLDDYILKLATQRNIPWVAFDQKGRKLSPDGKCVQNPPQGEVHARNQTQPETNASR